MHPLQEEIESRGWSIADLAARSSVCDRTLRYILFEGRLPRNSTRRLIFQALGKKWDYRKAQAFFGPLPHTAPPNGSDPT